MVSSPHEVVPVPVIILPVRGNESSPIGALTPLLLQARKRPGRSKVQNWRYYKERKLIRLHF
jgi:hypothetical protein